MLGALSVFQGQSERNSAGSQDFIYSSTMIFRKSGLLFVIPDSQNPVNGKGNDTKENKDQNPDDALGAVH